MDIAKHGDDPPPVVVIAGAGGFIGNAITRYLRGRYNVIGLSRSVRAASGWRTCNLLNLREAEAGLVGAKYAIYLVHSMMPTARLTQGSFADLDLLCADNFARAAAKANVEQIVYLGGLIPQTATLSPHLQSRREVEATLAAHGVPVTTLRAGLVLGGGGSSFDILVKLVRRLPAMICPRWTKTRTQPVAIDDVVALLAFAVGRPSCYGETFDVGAPEAMTYRDLMELCADVIGVRRAMLPVGFFSPSLSRLWVSLITGAPLALVGPLVESLRHEMVARDHRLADMAGLAPTPVREALVRGLAADRERESRDDGHRAKPPQVPVVQSVQRMKLPPNRTARWVAAEYARWLPRALRGLVRVDVDASENISFFMLFFREPLLTLVYSPERSAPDRQLYFIGRGRLSKATRHGRLEFRQVLNGRTLLVAIHDYVPRLPWFIYTVTQAPVHAIVMAAFRRHLARL